MKLPFVKASTAAALQRKVDALTAKLQDKEAKLTQTRTALKEAKASLKAAAGTATDTGALGPLLARMDARTILSLRYLRGDGLEVGAMHRPTPMAAEARTKYYDYMSAADSRKRFPHLPAQDIVEVDYIGNGETLDLIPESTLDYLIANHMLEHCQNVIGTLRLFWSKLKPGGALFISLPDKRYTFDFRRPVTPYEHYIQDLEQGPRQSLYQHYLEYQRLVGLVEESQLPSEAEVMAIQHPDIHFHVWTQAEMLDMFLRLRQDYDFLWEIEGCMRNHNEFVVVLRKEEVSAWDRAVPETQP